MQLNKLLTEKSSDLDKIKFKFSIINAELQELLPIRSRLLETLKSNRLLSNNLTAANEEIRLKEMLSKQVDKLEHKLSTERDLTAKPRTRLSDFVSKCKDSN